MNVEELTERVCRDFQARAVEFRLKQDQLQVEYVLNWGGFVAASFSVSDGERRLHVKLSSDTDGRSALRRWMSVHRLLEELYHAPRLIGWVDIDGTDYGGLVFDHVSGRVPDLKRDRDLFDEVVNVIERLHRDEDLAQIVRTNWTGETHLAAFRTRYIEMFREDLTIIEESLPPFVSQDTLRWMQSETNRLEQMAIESGAFRKSAIAPTHWDLWTNNILLTEKKDWYLLDWDDLSLGDPALDYATLAWPLTQGENAEDWQDLPITPTDERFAERMSLYMRTLMLDWVIDVLADWVDCEVAPQYRDMVREQKRKDHLHYLTMYREIYS